MPEGTDPAAEAEEMKAKFKDALNRKHANESGQIDRGHGHEPKPHETHGPEGGKRGFTRRKTG